jgi:hypothetical protein
MEFQTMISNAEIGAPQTQAYKRAGAAYRGINPLLYPGWDALLEAHPGSSFFHTAAWARVLHETYGHLPVSLSLEEDALFQFLANFFVFFNASAISFFRLT